MPATARASRGLQLRAYRRVSRAWKWPLKGTPGPPSFIGVGAGSAGARWWYTMLLSHPQVNPPRNRMITQSLLGEFCVRAMTDADVRAYHERFAHQPGKVAGEWDTTCLRSPWVAPLLPRVAPEAKLLVMLRDPIDRFRAAFASRVRRQEAGGHRVWTASAGMDGCYASHLRHLRRFVAPENVLVLQFERCRADPVGQYRRTLRFLGVDEEQIPRRFLWTVRSDHRRLDRTLQHVGVPDFVIAGQLGRPGGGMGGGPLWPEMEGSLHALLDSEVADLAELVPELDLALWPSFRHLAG